MAVAVRSEGGDTNLVMSAVTTVASQVTQLARFARADTKVVGKATAGPPTKRFADYIVAVWTAA